MSLIASMLGWTKAPQWALELIVIAGLAGGFWWYHHHVFVQGIAAQQAADDKAAAPLLAQAKAETQAEKKRADLAEESYREEAAAAAAAAARPVGPVRLCLDAHVGRPSLPEAAAADTGARGASAAAGRVPLVPRGDPSLRQDRPGPDLEQLLGAWAHAADKVSATLRECKAR